MSLLTTLISLITLDLLRMNRWERPFKRVANWARLEHQQLALINQNHPYHPNLLQCLLFQKQVPLPIGNQLTQELLKQLYHNLFKRVQDLYGACPDKLTLPKEVTSKQRTWSLLEPTVITQEQSLIVNMKLWHQSCMNLRN